MQTHFNDTRIHCTYCDRTFNRSDNASYHERHCTNNPANNTVRYPSNPNPPPRGQGLPAAAEESANGNNATTNDNFRITTHSRVFSGAGVTYRLRYGNHNIANYEETLQNSITLYLSRITNFLRTNRALKYNMALHVVLEKSTDPDILTDPPVVLVSEQLEVYANTDINTTLETTFRQLKNRVELYQHTGSGWVLSRMIYLDLSLWKLHSLRGGTSSFHALPMWLKNTNCVVNVKNRDTHCFKWAVLASLFHKKIKKNKDRIRSYQNFESWDGVPNFDGLEFPFELKNIKKFEKLNPDISVNVYGVDYTFEREGEGEQQEDHPLAVPLPFQMYNLPHKH